MRRSWCRGGFESRPRRPSRIPASSYSRDAILDEEATGVIEQRTRRLAIAAALVDSFLAGANFNRALVEMPAWQRTGPLTWAAFSRHADLAGNVRGVFQVLAFVANLWSVAALSERPGRKAGFT